MVDYSLFPLISKKDPFCLVSGSDTLGTIILPGALRYLSRVWRYLKASNPFTFYRAESQVNHLATT